ncbi:glycosyltransferase involved in cell wall biosynthesis [Idiomarina loihiensis]|uniref:glycosyltransferase family 4 protein n=1 Tax=Idiomarina TaxID=135575 RepID=UPI000D71B90A|nr:MULTISPECIES: glycosyltransferase family 4 protein [Idiomarina]PWW37691.1 glycosyltransferase involved in cell wall biosynthesis [Idiomarina loihiensis]TDP47402.1 glycosyltransferase involved in cell wall biosynthesis [Idiomarina loihiensis]TDS23143.1 glycosyltransferase involved in cell wall biosynthesis [Idiomarina sp. H2]
MAKAVWIINQYASLPTTGIGGRHRALARELVKLGYDVTLVSSRWTHLVRDADLNAGAPDQEEFEGFRFIRLPSRKYQHAHDKFRIWNWFVFAWQVNRLDRRLKAKPDIVVYSSPSLVGVLGAKRLASRVNAKLVFEVRDIWPLTFREVGGYSERNPFIQFMQWIEDYAYRTADHVTSNLQGAVEHMESRGLSNKNFTWIGNGFSLDELIETEELPSSIDDRIPTKGFKVCYAGTIGSANALDSLVDAASLLSRKRTDIHFILVGHGKNKTSLEAKARSLKLSNVTFLEPVSKQKVQKIIEKCDACFIGWKSSNLYEYGIAANKLFDYLYSGKPILHAFSGRYDPVVKYGAGITVPAEDACAIARGVVSLADMSSENRKLMGERGYTAVVADHEYGVLSKKYDELFKELLKDKDY